MQTSLQTLKLRIIRATSGARAVVCSTPAGRPTTLCCVWPRRRAEFAGYNKSRSFVSVGEIQGIKAARENAGFKLN